jgi:periplasmic protein CpxP/Spy
MPKFINRAGAVATAALFGAFLATVPLQASQAQQTAAQPQAASPAASMAGHGKHSADRTELRIKQLHDQLRITPDQEALWGTVAQSMRDSAQSMRASLTDRSTRLKTMTAVEDLKSYQAVADQHAAGLKQLVPAFESLYASMTPAQQKRADQVFGSRQHHAHG